MALSPSEKESVFALDIYRQWAYSLLKGHRSKKQGHYDEACELYHTSLQHSISLVERLEASLSHRLKAFKHFSVTAHALSRLYEDMDLIEEAREMLVTHFVFLNKVVFNNSTPLLIRDMARQEIYRSRELLKTIYLKLDQPELAMNHDQRCQQIYYTLLH